MTGTTSPVVFLAFADGRELTDPAQLPAQARLVGSSKSQPADLRCTARGNAPLASKIAWRGFRVAMPLEEIS
ncbi:MAG: hypothetical protein BWY52_02838 [Chloroflexi bacterium ADurb.Bin325]|nr:MAG: hypothetical protein BWY52_02838 [Chloroflexi bacterium ADurb.Bin325]